MSLGTGGYGAQGYGGNTGQALSTTSTTGATITFGVSASATGTAGTAPGASVTFGVTLSATGVAGYSGSATINVGATASATGAVPGGNILLGVTMSATGVKAGATAVFGVTLSATGTKGVITLVNTTATGSRVRSSAIPPVVFQINATGLRTRSVSVVSPVLLTVSSASGTRVRSGYAYPLVQGTGSGGVLVPQFQRWRVDDPITHTSFVFEANPYEGGSTQRTRSITTRPTCASDGTNFYFEGQEDVWAMDLKGKVLTQSQYDNFRLWFAKRYLVLLTDDLGRQMQVYLEQWNPKRASLRHHPYRVDYTMKIKVVALGAAQVLT